MINATSRVTLRRTAVIAAVVATLGLLAGACGTSEPEAQGSGGGGETAESTPSTLEPDAGTPKDGGKLAYALVAETSGWDPTSGQWAASGHQVATAIYDRLGAFDENYQVKPFLASSITPNADFTEWTLGVRPDVKFHNGDPVDAAAIVTNLLAYKNGALTGKALSPIDDVVAGPGGDTVVIKMSKPFSTYPLQLTSQVGVVAWPGMYDKAANPDATRNPVGSGPFVFKSWEQGAKLNVTKNPNYWREGLPHLDEIEFSIVVDNQSRQSALKTGTVDMAEFFDIESITEFRNNTSDDEFRILADPNGEGEEALIMFNTSEAPLSDPNARKALAMGTNNAELMTALYDDELQAAHGPFLPNSKWFAEGTGNPEFNAEEAKKLVQQVKDDGDGTFEFTLTGVPVVETQRLVQALQQQWAPLGITITLEDTEQATLINRAVTNDYQAMTWRQFGSPHPDGEYVWTTCENIIDGGLSLNFARNCNETLDAALNKARTTDNFEEQKAQYDIFQQELSKDIPYLWLYETESVVIASTNVHDITKAVLPDGEKQLSMVSVVHPVAQIWVS